MRRKRRKKKNLRIILTALLVAAFVAALGAVLIWKVFVVKDVSVKGNEIYTDKQIEDWVLDEKYSWNSLYVYFENKLNKTEEIPFVDSPVEIAAEAGNHSGGKGNPWISVHSVTGKKCIF